MTEPTPEKLEEFRKLGMRPGVVACYLNNRKLLFLYKADYKIWMLPQCGIEQGETPSAALLRETKEELGGAFLAKCTKDIIYIGEDQIEFLPGKHDDEKIILSDKSAVDIKGKAYFFYTVPVTESDFDVNATEFNDYFWLDYISAKFLADRIHQTGKKRITSKIVRLLKELGKID